jgi:hypothetical protein
VDADGACALTIFALPDEVGVASVKQMGTGVAFVLHAVGVPERNFLGVVLVAVGAPDHEVPLIVLR